MMSKTGVPSGMLSRAASGLIGIRAVISSWTFRPGDVEGARDGVVGPDDVEDGRAVGDAQPGGLRADRHPGCYLLLDLRNGRHRVDAGDVAARSSAGDEVGVAVAGGDGEIAVG